MYYHSIVCHRFLVCFLHVKWDAFGKTRFFTETIVLLPALKHGTFKIPVQVCKSDCECHFTTLLPFGQARKKPAGHQIGGHSCLKYSWSSLTHQRQLTWCLTHIAKVWYGQIFCPTLTPDASWIIFYITLLNWESCWNGIISFETFVESEISCYVPRFSSILTAKFHSIYVKESESEILERLELEILESRSRKFGKSGVRYFTSDSATLVASTSKEAAVMLIKLQSFQFKCWSMFPSIFGYF